MKNNKLTSKENDKYIMLEDDTIEDFKGKLYKNRFITSKVKLYRIKALKDFGNIKKGQLGGYIEKEENLKFDCNAWVSDNAKVFEDAEVSDEAIVSGNVIVYGESKIYDNAKVSGNVNVYCNSQIYGDAEVSGNVHIFGKDVKIYGKVKISGEVKIFGNTDISGNVKISGYVEIHGNVRIMQNVEIGGNVEIYGNADIFGDAKIYNNNQWYCIENANERNYSITFFETDRVIYVAETDPFIGFTFKGTLLEFEQKIEKEYRNTIYEKEYKIFIELAKLKLLESVDK